MKKVLLTSTALVAFAGAASAEVSLSGSAEMGIIGGDDMETQFFQSVDVRFSLSGETDGGLTFGASIDLEDVSDSAQAGSDLVDDTGFADYTVFISGAFGTVTMGDTDGAMDWALTEAGNIGNPGSIADDETSHAGYLGSYLDGFYDGQIVRYDNTFGDFGVAVSLEMDDTEDASGDTADVGYALGLRYSTDLGGADIALGLGYQSASAQAGDVVDYASDILGSTTLTDDLTIDAIGFSAVATLDSGFTGGLVYTQFNIDGIDEDLTHLGIGVGYAFDAVSLHANYGVYSFDDDEVSGFGLAAGYDLGGGASVLFGYGSSDFSDVGGDTVDTWSLGLSMSF